MLQVVALGSGGQGRLADGRRLTGALVLGAGLALTSISHGTAGEAEAEAETPGEAETPHPLRASSDADIASAGRTALSRIRPPLISLRRSRRRA
jgi:hypothetical protein